MKKWGYLIIVILLLWLAAYATVSFLKGSSTFDSSDRIAVVEIKGMITSGGSAGLFGGSTASSEFIVKTLKAADEDPKVKGILLDINSGGGTVVASASIASAVKKMSKPVVAYIGDVGASGAYWAATSADVIVCDPMSITGSVGVAASYLEFSGLMADYGVGYERLSGGKYKEMGGPYQKLSDDEKKLLQSKIDMIHEYFLNDVIENRKEISPAAIEEMQTGVFYLGKEAYDRNMVDYLGDKDLAVNMTKELANIDKAKLIEYKEKRKFTDILDRVYANAFYSIGRGIGMEMMSRAESPIEIMV